MTRKDFSEYYALRAPVYEDIYAKPERQAELVVLREYLQQAVTGLDVLEIACGTGYWTHTMARTANSLLATDINEQMLVIAREKDYRGLCNPVFQCIDMYRLEGGAGYNALFGGFIWSHIPLEEMGAWLDHLHGLLRPGSKVIFMDNNFVEGSSTPVSTIDGFGNVYQERTLGTDKFQVIKNFPSEGDFRKVLEQRGKNIMLLNLQYFWALQYELGNG